MHVLAAAGAVSANEGPGAGSAAAHKNLIVAICNLARLEFERGDLAAAAMRYDGIMAAARKVLGESNSDTITCAANLASARMMLGTRPGVEPAQRDAALGEAEALYRDCVTRSRGILGNAQSGTDVLNSALVNLAGLLLVRGRHECLGEAKALLEEALSTMPQAPGEEDGLPIRNARRYLAEVMRRVLVSEGGGGSTLASMIPP